MKKLKFLFVISIVNSGYISRIVNFKFKMLKKIKLLKKIYLNKFNK